jgi:hypothetical protein
MVVSNARDFNRWMHHDHDHRLRDAGLRRLIQ